MTLGQASGQHAQPDDCVAAALRDLLAATDHLRELLAGIADLAVETIPACGSASITIIHDGTPATPASSDSRARQIDESQYVQGQGPCLRAARTAEAVQVDDISTATQTGTWQNTAKLAYITASLSMPLITSANVDAALNLYTERESGWASEVYEHAELLATHAGDAITVAYRLGHPDTGSAYWPYHP